MLHIIVPLISLFVYTNAVCNGTIDSCGVCNGNYSCDMCLTLPNSHFVGYGYYEASSSVGISGGAGIPNTGETYSMMIWFYLRSDQPSTRKAIFSFGTNTSCTDGNGFSVIIEADDSITFADACGHGRNILYIY